MRPITLSPADDISKRGRIISVTAIGQHHVMRELVNII
jgi:hypothetical protein